MTDRFYNDWPRPKTKLLGRCAVCDREVFASCSGYSRGDELYCGSQCYADMVEIEADARKALAKYSSSNIIPSSFIVGYKRAARIQRIQQQMLREIMEGLHD